MASPVVSGRTERLQMFVEGRPADRERAARLFHLLVSVQYPYGIFPIRQRAHGDWVIDLTDTGHAQGPIRGTLELFALLGVEGA